MEHSYGEDRIACDIQADGRHMSWRPKMAGEKLTENNCHEWKLRHSMPKKGAHGDHILLYLLCIGGPLKWMMLLPVIQKPDDDYPIHEYKEYSFTGSYSIFLNRLIS